jgi:polysaccharide export outer membrane protein
MKKLFHLLLLMVIAWNVPVLKAEDTDPLLKPNDTISLKVFDETELDTNTRILKSGEVVFPLIGTVKIGGLTVSKANELVRELYAKDYLVDPKVTLTISQYSEDFISVIGAVRTAGQFAMPPDGKFDLAAALASAGGLSPEANSERITVVKPDGQSEVYSATATRNGTGINLQPGDRVIVDHSSYLGKTATVVGQVGRPGPVQFPVNGRLDLVLAIAQAGGFSQVANQKKVSINRKGKLTTVDVKEMTDRGDKPYYLQPDDIVTVPERFF